MPDNQEIIKELRTILKIYHYESVGSGAGNEQHMSKDVATSLENLLGTILKGVKPCPTKKQ